MSTGNDTLRDLLSRTSELTITVTGRKSGHPISNPVWFVFEGGKLYLLPVNGSETQWYKNVLNNPKVQIEAGRVQAELKVVPINDQKQVGAIADKFREKYGRSDVKKYYSNFDVALVSDVP